MTKTESWNLALRREIAAQRELIQRMDYPPNREMCGNGIMADIRQERLDLLERLLEFEPKDQRGPLLTDEPTGCRCKNLPNEGPLIDGHLSACPMAYEIIKHAEPTENPRTHGRFCAIHGWRDCPSPECNR